MRRSLEAKERQYMKTPSSMAPSCGSFLFGVQLIIIIMTISSADEKALSIRFAALSRGEDAGLLLP
jgi:hypothetical protein